MSLEVWLAFLAAATVIVVIPGPTVMVVLSYSLAHGRRAAWPLVAGVTLGDLVAMTVSLAGLGAAIAASATLYTALKWAGAAYLVYLGLRLWRADPAAADGLPQPSHPRRSRALFAQAFTVTALNPKSIAFFVAFVPQFLTPDAALLPQLGLMEVTFVTVAALNAAAYALIAARLRATMGRPAVLKLLNRMGASLMIGAGIATAAMRRA